MPGDEDSVRRRETKRQRTAALQEATARHWIKLNTASLALTFGKQLLIRGARVGVSRFEILQFAGFDEALLLALTFFHTIQAPLRAPA
jgi:hypothetical protein